MRMRLKGHQGRSRKGVSEVIAVLLLVLIVLIVIVFVLIFATGVINDLIAGGVATPITASGQMVVPGSTNDNGFLTLTVRNSQAQAISLISVTCPSSFVTGPNCVEMTYDDQPVAPSTSVPPGGLSEGTALVTSSSGPFVAGNTYSILVAVSFSGGAQTTLDVSVGAVS